MFYERRYYFNGTYLSITSLSISWRGVEKTRESFWQVHERKKASPTAAVLSQWKLMKYMMCVKKVYCRKRVKYLNEKIKTSRMVRVWSGKNDFFLYKKVLFWLTIYFLFNKQQRILRLVFHPIHWTALVLKIKKQLKSHPETRSCVLLGSNYKLDFIFFFQVAAAATLKLHFWKFGNAPYCLWFELFLLIFWKNILFWFKDNYCLKFS